MSIHLKGLQSGQLGEATIVVGDPGRVDLVSSLFDDSQTVTDNRELKLATGTYQGHSVSVCATGMGSGATEICITELIENDAKQIVRCGGCGAWRDGIEVGDIILNSGMVRSKGMMSSYVLETFPAVADPDLLIRLKHAHERREVATHVGVGFTSEGYYAGQARMPKIEGAIDTRDLFEYMTKRWVMNCEMETAILYILGSLYGVPVANSLVTHVTRKNDHWATDEEYRAMHKMNARVALEAMLNL